MTTSAVPPLLAGGRRTVVRLLGLVVGANLVGAVTVALLLVGLSGGRNPQEPGTRTVLLLVVIGYGVLALPLGIAAGLQRQRVTRAWLAAGRPPSRTEAAHALRLPLDTALVAALTWLVGAVLAGVVAGVVSPDPAVGLRTGLSSVLGGIVTTGVSYLLVDRAARPVTTRALAAHPPTGSLLLGVRVRMFLAWGLTSGVPLLGLVSLFLDPSLHGRVSDAAVVFLAVVALVVGGLATLLTARAVGSPLRELRHAVQEIGQGDTSVRVVVDDAGEIGLLQDGVNTMAAGLGERERLRDLFGRHVGATVAQQALDRGIALGGEERTVAALFVDVTGSTALAQHAGAEAMVGLLNRFFAVVVEATSAEGGLVNKFQGDAALCVFGAPADHPDPAGAALRAARAVVAAVAAAGEVDIGVGVAFGPVVAGQVGARSRLEYTVIGDPVNEAARLTELAKALPGRVLATGRAVRAAAGDEAAHWVPGEVLTLRGRAQPTPTWVRAG
ncbi:adenylate/guanylate cyclase domain-containing protein [Modestobacter sp. NPDC049651]|uniref:adenylate/guanylate cyclase domain-containing protein n=1 Tax=unclassified Modestobacter TaxID=2643866 RepID=UPI0033F8B808